MRCPIYLPSNCNMEIIVRSVKENLNAIKHVEEMMDGLFPEEEQSSVNGLLELSVNSGVHFDLYYLNGEVCGFSYIVCKYDLVFIYYLAVKEKYQSMGCGTKILEIIKGFYNNCTLVLPATIWRVRFTDKIVIEKRAAFTPLFLYENLIY